MDGKSRTFLRHLEPLQGALEGYCRRALNDQSDVEDVLQSAVANAFRDFHLYAEGTNFRAWIFQYVSYEILNRNRSAKRHRHAALPGDLCDESSESMVAAFPPKWESLLRDPGAVLDHCDELLANAVREMPEIERHVFLLRALGEFKHREIAEILEIPLGTVMSHLSRGRARLRQRVLQYARERGDLPGGDAPSS